MPRVSLLFHMPETPAELKWSDPVEDVPGIGENRGEDLRRAGYETVEDLQRATVKEVSEVLRADVAASVLEKVGGPEDRPSTSAQARERAQEVPGAVGRVVKRNGRPVPVVLKKESEQNLPGATVTVRKG